MDHLLEQIIQDEDNLHRNMITLNLLPKQLPSDKMELLETRLKLELATKLWSPSPVHLSPEVKALYIQALKASCMNPFDFYGYDLVSDLANDYRNTFSDSSQLFNDSTQSREFNQHQVAFTLCLVSNNSSQFESLIGNDQLQSLLKIEEIHSRSVHQNHHDVQFSEQQENSATFDQSVKIEQGLNELLMKFMSVSCYSKLNEFNQTIRNDLNDLLAKILLKQNPETGSFGGKMITTALAVQAFIESGLDRLSFLWDRRKALHFINEHLKEAGNSSQEVYFTVPAFHRTWHEIGCRDRTNENNIISDEDIKRVMSYSEALKEILSDRISNSSSMSSTINVTLSRWVQLSPEQKAKIVVPVPPKSFLLKVIKEAAKVNPSFKYDTIQSSLYGTYIKSLGDVEENKSLKKHWTIHQEMEKDQLQPVNQSKLMRNRML